MSDDHEGREESGLAARGPEDDSGGLAARGPEDDSGGLAARGPKFDGNFEALWSTLENPDEVATIATLETLRFHRDGGNAAGSELPRVDHLLALGSVLAVGGTGEVVAAQQKSLDRIIAVKRLINEGESGVSEGLLREARVIGYLEHPNIPPVHFVGSGPRGELLVGLKHIEGKTFAEKLAAEAPLQNLDENLDTLMLVCNALSFAHERGILHLDIKPENVMMGAHGEVYLVDWGLGSAYRDDVVTTIPRASERRGLCGTPAYLAPEMVIGGPFTPATDVYMLGGLLHRMLTGRPPNEGATTFAALQSAYEPPPREFDEDVPSLLGEICARALAPVATDRFATAAQFRDAVHEFRQQRQRIDALSVAVAAVAQLDAALNVAPVDGPQVYQRWGAARQALNEARRLHADRDAIAELLQETLESLVRWELDRENLGGAELLLADLPKPNAELEAACQGLRARHERDRQELEALRLDLDPSVGTRRKVVLVIAIGVVIALIELVPFLLGIPPTTGRVLAGYVVYLGVLAGLSYGLRRTLFTTRTNRSLAYLVWLLSLFGVMIRIGGFAGVLPLHAVAGYDLVLVVLVTVFSALTLDRALGTAAPIYAFFAMACFVWPEYAMLSFGFSHLVGLSAVALAMAYRRP